MIGREAIPAGQLPEDQEIVSMDNLNE